MASAGFLPPIHECKGDLSIAGLAKEGLSGEGDEGRRSEIKIEMTIFKHTGYEVKQVKGSIINS